MGITVFEASKIAKESILKTVNKETVVQKTGQILVDYKTGDVLYGNVTPYESSGYLFDFIYRNDQVELKVL